MHATTMCSTRSPHPRSLCALLLGAALLGGCGGGGSAVPGDAHDSAEPARLRFVHAVVRGPTVSVYCNARRQASGAGFRFASGYFPIDAGTTTCTLESEGKPRREYAHLSFDTRPGERYTIVALPAERDAELLLVADPDEDSAIAGITRVRFVNTAFDTGSVDVYLSARKTSIDGSTPSFERIHYKRSGDRSMTLEAGHYLLRVTPSGSRQPLLDKWITLEDGSDWLLATVPNDASGIEPPSELDVLQLRSDREGEDEDEDERDQEVGKRDAESQQH